MANQTQREMQNRLRSQRAVFVIAMALLAIAAAISLATVSGNISSKSPESFPIHAELNNTKNDSANQTCGPGSYCYTQITLLNGYFFPWYGQTGPAITFLMDRIQILTYGEILLGFAVALEFPMLLFYFNRKFKALESRKVGPDDKNFWIVVPAVVRAALSETDSGQAVLKWWDDQVRKDAIPDIEAAIQKAKKGQSQEA